MDELDRQMSVDDVYGSIGKTHLASQHFVPGELACPHCHACIVVPSLIVVLERIRRHIGRPLPIVSGYRCPIHNLQVGGAADSQHMYGTAVDVPLGIVSEPIAAHAGAIGIGLQDGSVRHLDVRDGPRARWHY